MIEKEESTQNDNADQSRYVQIMNKRTNMFELLNEALLGLGFTRTIADVRWFQKGDLWFFNCPHKCNTMTLYRDFNPEKGDRTLAEFFESANTAAIARWAVTQEMSNAELLGHILQKIDEASNVTESESKA